MFNNNKKRQLNINVRRIYEESEMRGEYAVCSNKLKPVPFLHEDNTIVKC